MKKAQEVVLNDVYHTIKSPIVTIKSQLFVLGRNKNIQGIKEIKDKLIQIEEKVNLLHKRAEIFLNYMLLKEGKIEFLYSFFNLGEVLKTALDEANTQSKEVKFVLKSLEEKTVMADKDQILASLKTILIRSQSQALPGVIEVAMSAKRSVEIVFSFKQKEIVSNKPIHSDEECVAREMEYIAWRTIELHGGSIHKSENGKKTTVIITIPQKARVKRSKLE